MKLDFVRTLLNKDNAMVVGISLFAIGLIWSIAPYIFLKNPAERQAVMLKAQQFEKDEFERMQKTENSRRRLLIYSKGLMLVGICILVAALV